MGLSREMEFNADENAILMDFFEIIHYLSVNQNYATMFYGTIEIQIAKRDIRSYICQ